MKEITKRGLTVWKTISIGGGTPEELSTKVARSCERVGYNAKFLMKEMEVSSPTSNIDLVVLTLDELGFTFNPSTDAFMTREFCTKWSEENLDGCFIELCEAEDGPQLREQYQDQQKYEVLTMVMERISDPGGYKRVFVVERLGSGDRCLDTDWMRPNTLWSLDTRVVYRFRKLPLLTVS